MPWSGSGRGLAFGSRFVLATTLWPRIMMRGPSHPYATFSA
jgi:hypothetical protein